MNPSPTHFAFGNPLKYLAIYSLVLIIQIPDINQKRHRMRQYFVELVLLMIRNLKIMNILYSMIVIMSIFGSVNKTNSALSMYFTV